jgi:threonine aldolase
MMRLAKRARKRLSGGTRQVGVIATMGLYALRNNVEWMGEDHVRVHTNIGYFGLPGKDH